MKSTHDTTADSTPDWHASASAGAYDEPSTDVNETPPQTPMVEVGADAVADVPTDPIEEIRRKYGPDIIRPASQFPRKAKGEDAADCRSSAAS
jgi:hypothetical protein